MEGLEKILNRIIDDSKAKVDELIAKANAEAKDITDAMKEKVEEKCSEILSQTSSEKKIIEERTIASKEHKLKQMKLTTRREAIDETLRLAKEKISTLPDKDYMDLLSKAFDKYLRKDATSDKVSLLFGEKDLKRVPKDLVDTFVKKASEKGMTLSVSDKAANISNGFILDYGDILENCSFDAMIDQNKDELEDSIKKILF